MFRLKILALAFVSCFLPFAFSIFVFCFQRLRPVYLVSISSIGRTIDYSALDSFMPAAKCFRIQPFCLPLMLYLHLLLPFALVGFSWAFGFYLYIGITSCVYKISQFSSFFNPQYCINSQRRNCAIRRFAQLHVFFGWLCCARCAMMILLGGLSEAAHLLFPRDPALLTFPGILWYN